MLPSSDRDHQRLFAGFDGDQICLASNYYQYGKPEVNGLRFIRLGISDLKPISDTKILGVTQVNPGSIVAQPVEKATWVNPPSLAADLWVQFTETGKKTGQELEHRNGINAGAIALGEKKLLVFYGRADGVVISYDDHRTSELKLPCSPGFYGTSNDPEYAGAICTTSPDRESEFGGDKILKSEFVLLRTSNPAVVWRQKMNWLDVRNDAHGIDGGYQKGNPLIYRTGSKLLIVAPSKAPALTVYEIDAPQ